MTGSKSNLNPTSLLNCLHQQTDNTALWQAVPPSEAIQSLSSALQRISDLQSPQPNTELLLALIRSKAQHLDNRVHFQQVGTVQQIGNGVANLSGLPEVKTDELVTFSTGVQGMVLNLNRRSVDVILLGPDHGIRGGDLVIGSGQRLQIPVGSQLIGRIVDPLGNPLDDKSEIEATTFRYLEQDAPGITERAPVSEPLHTGAKIVDALVPIGRGQRELIIGNRQTGKTTLAIDTILNQRHSDVKCVYVAIGQKKSSTLAVIERLRQAQALAYTTVVLSSPDDPPALTYLAPYTGCTLAEYLMRQGQDVLIVYDDLSKHAEAYRELSLLLRRAPGREAYPGDIFYLHARLLERACKLNPEAGSGSLTALPIVQVQRGNISAYIPTNLISITDGQIFLDAERFNRGLKPALHVGLSVSRVGGAAQTESMRALAGPLRLELAQFEEVAHFTRFGTEVDESTRRQIERGRRLEKALTQPAHRPLSLALQIVSLLTVVGGYLDDIPAKQVVNFEEGLLKYVETGQTALLDKLNLGEQLSDNMRSNVEQVIASYHQLWLKRHGEP